MKFNEIKMEINEFLKNYFSNKGTYNKVIYDAVSYSVNIGGKRIRPILMLLTYSMYEENWRSVLEFASAIEMIHTYSLIHDDLPCMDDDDLRRGKPTNHRVFGEAIAILAGDALLTHAFRLICQDEELNEKQKLRLIDCLSEAAGPTGMVAGQVLDMEAEQKELTLSQLKEVHLHKTGRLIEFSVIAAGIIANASEPLIQDLKQFSRHIGLAFQIKDDILDVEGERDLIGKDVGSDLENGKNTYVSLATLAGAKQLLNEEIETALSYLNKISFDTTLLASITCYIKDRQS